MLQSIKKLLGLGPKTDWKNLVRQGATIIDVRTPYEYKTGHIQGALNIPLDRLPDNLKRIAKNKPVITCCASGMRSAQAKNILKSKGYEAYNGGGWNSLLHKL